MDGWILDTILNRMISQIGALIKSFVHTHAVKQYIFADPPFSSLPLDGCPSIAKVGPGTWPGDIEGENILAGRLYAGKGNNLPELSCTSDHIDYNPGKFTGINTAFKCGSAIINAGCKWVVFSDYNFGGTSKEFVGPAVLSTIETDGTIFVGCGDGNTCVRSMVWTCTQSFPSCVPSDEWQPFTELDNSQSSGATKFTYLKTVGKF